MGDLVPASTALRSAVPRRPPPAVTETGDRPAGVETVPPGPDPPRRATRSARDDDGRILLARLSAIEVDVGAWTLPGGGIEFGEHPDAAVHPRARGGDGPDGEIEDVAGVFSHVYRRSRAAQGGDLHFLGILYHIADRRRRAARRDRRLDRHRAPGSVARRARRTIRLVELARYGVELAFAGAARAMRSTIGIDVAAPADARLPARPRRRALAAAPAPLRPRPTRSRAPDADGPARRPFVARRSLVPVLGLGLPVAWRSLTWSEPADAPAPVRPPRRRDRTGWTSRGGSSRRARGALPGRHRARLPAARPGLGLVHRPALHPADRRPDAGDVPGDRRGGRRRRRSVRDRPADESTA